MTNIKGGLIMTTDFTPHPPHVEYKATLKVTATREEFQELYNFMESSGLREYRDSKIFDEVLNEIEEIIHWIDTGTEYGGI